MQDYNTIIGAIQMRLNKCPTRSVMDRFRIGSSTLICFKNPPMRIVKIITMSIQTRWSVMIFLFTLFPSQTIHFHHEPNSDFQAFLKSGLLPCTAHRSLPVHDLLPKRNLISDVVIYEPIHSIQPSQPLFQFLFFGLCRFTGNCVFLGSALHRFIALYLRCRSAPTLIFSLSAVPGKYTPFL